MRKSKIYSTENTYMSKISDSNSFRPNKNYSEICDQANANQVEPIRKKFSISFVENRLKINPTQSKTSNRMNPNKIFNPNEFRFGFIRIHLVWVNLSPDCLEFIQIKSDFVRTIFNKRD